jgi:pimeloyl-ACP methyl ester carboxylesterase
MTTTSPRREKVEVMTTAAAQGPTTLPAFGDPTHGPIGGVWRSRLIAIGFVEAAAAAYGAFAGWWTPRGPDDTTQALSAIALGLGVGALSGAVLRSRWAMLLAPITFITMFELVRLEATGATVDETTLSSEYGVMAFVVGRLFHGLLALLPMAVGVAFGRSWALRRAGTPVSRSSFVGRIGSALRGTALLVSTAALLVLAVALVRPATTDPILGADGERLPGSIAEFATVDIGGDDQTMLIRGQDADDPVVLFLAGGPGGSELGAMSQYAHPLEQDFVVVTWDQLGTGRSTGQFDPQDTLSLDRAVSDTMAVTEYLQDRFDEDRIYLVGNSYGTFLGVRAAERRPDLYAAFVGTGQMVSVVETDRMFYEDALAHAAETGDTALTATLLANGEPPYDDLLDMAPLVASEHEWNDYTGIDGFPGRREPTDNLFVTEYSLMDQVRSMANLLDTYVTLYPELYDVDLRDTTRLEVPVYLVQGAHEARGRAVLAQQWFDQLDAPDKELFTFERSGHRPWIQEPERFAQVMTDTVLARTAPDAEVDGMPAGEVDEADELRNLFADYNPAVWPAHVLAYALGLAALWLIHRRPGPRTNRLVTGLLAAAWLWLGIVFFGRHAAEIDPLLSAAYGALFVYQAFLFVRAGIVGERLAFTSRNGLAGRVGWLALGYALVVYPVIGVVLGHGYPESPLFGMAPCPTTIATFGLLLLVRPPLPRHLLIIPLVWAVLAPLAAVGHGYPEDLGLVVAGAAALLLVLTQTRRSTDDHHRKIDQRPDLVPTGDLR